MSTVMLSSLVVAVFAAAGALASAVLGAVLAVAPGVLLALGVLLAFAHELLRRDGRPRLVESVTGTFTGQAVVVLGAGWVFLPMTADGVGAVAVAGGAAIVARYLPSTRAAGLLGEPSIDLDAEVDAGPDGGEAVPVRPRPAP